MQPTPRFIQGVFSFEGKGLEFPCPLAPAAGHAVANDKRGQMVYLRAGNASDELVYLVLTRSTKPMRYFPIGPKQSVHVPLAVVEDIFPESRLEILIGAPLGLKGSIVLDCGLLEVD